MLSPLYFQLFFLWFFVLVVVVLIVFVYNLVEKKCSQDMQKSPECLKFDDISLEICLKSIISANKKILKTKEKSCFIFPGYAPGLHKFSQYLPSMVICSSFVRYVWILERHSDNQGKREIISHTYIPRSELLMRQTSE